MKDFPRYDSWQIGKLVGVDQRTANDGKPTGLGHLKGGFAFILARFA